MKITAHLIQSAHFFFVCPDFFCLFGDFVDPNFSFNFLGILSYMDL